MGISISILGEECERALWYELRWASQPEVIDGLKAITFETGNIEETRLLNALRMIGCEVDEVDHRGKQYRASAVAGHVRGKMDGKVLGLPEAVKTWHVVECKSMKETYWKAVVKDGVRKGYYAHLGAVRTFTAISSASSAASTLPQQEHRRGPRSERIETDHVEAIRLFAALSASSRPQSAAEASRRPRSEAGLQVQAYVQAQGDLPRQGVRAHLVPHLLARDPRDVRRRGVVVRSLEQAALAR